MSIKKKLVLFIVIILVLPITILAFFSYKEAKEGLVSFARRQMQLTAHDAINTVKTILEFELRANESLLSSDDLLSSLVEDELAKMRISKGSYIFVINRTGRILVHPQREKKINMLNYLDSKSEDIRMIARRMLDEKEGFGEFIDNGDDAYIYFIKYDQAKVLAGSSIIDAKYDLGWSLAVAMPQDVVLEKARKIFIISITISALSLLVFSFLGYFLIHSAIVGPVLNLAGFMNRLSKDYDLSTRIKKGSDDEIGILYDGFNSMLGRIEEGQNNLNQLRNYLSNIIDSMPSILVGVDFDGKVTLWNKRAENVTGLTFKQAQGRAISDVLARFSIEQDIIEKAIHEKQILVDQKVFDVNDKMRKFSDITIYPLIANGAIGAVVRVDDVTERVRLQEIMIQTEKMMSVGGLAAGMAHEINNPLGTILQGAQNIERRLSSQLEKNSEYARECGTDMSQIEKYMHGRGIYEFLDGIRQAGARASKIVRNMLSFSRQSELAKKDVVLSELIEDTIDLASNDYDLKKKFDFRHIEVIREFSDEVNEVPCIITELEQVILNLLKNAAQSIADVDTTSIKGKIIIRTSLENRNVCIEVEDNGAGMSQEVCKRIFEPFFTTKPVGVGTGLGLSVSYFIITENHGGTMQVHSEIGKGTKFIIHLPL